MEIVVCIKQVPSVSELPWDAKRKRFKRELAGGMMNPACKIALEAGLRLKRQVGGRVSVLSMGPPEADEVIREAIALGADRGYLLSDHILAGADTLATSHALALAVRKICPDFDLILTGIQTTDSETGQVGPQLAEELDLATAAGVHEIKPEQETIVIERITDNFRQKLRLPLPALVTVAADAYQISYVPMAGVEEAFGPVEVKTLTAADIGAEPSKVGAAGSPTVIVDVKPTDHQRKGVHLKGAAMTMVTELFDRFGDSLGGAIGRDLKKD